MNRASGDFQHDSIAPCSATRPSARLAAQIIGQAYVNAYNLDPPEQGRPSRRSPTRSSRGEELYGDELVDLLNSVGLKEPTIDLSKEEAWPTL